MTFLQSHFLSRKPLYKRNSKRRRRRDGKRGNNEKVRKKERRKEIERERVEGTFVSSQEGIPQKCKSTSQNAKWTSRCCPKKLFFFRFAFSKALLKMQLPNTLFKFLSFSKSKSFKVLFSNPTKHTIELRLSQKSPSQLG